MLDRWKLNLARNSDGSFSRATPQTKTHSLEVSEPIFDTHNWWHRDLVILINAHFPDGETAMMHYHPGRSGDIRRAALGLATLLVRAGIIVSALRGRPSMVKGSLAFQSGSHVFGDVAEVGEHLEGTSYPIEGYYIEHECILRGKMTRSDFS